MHLCLLPRRSCAHCAFFSHAKRRENEATKGRGHGISQPKERRTAGLHCQPSVTSNSHIPSLLSFPLSSSSCCYHMDALYRVIEFPTEDRRSIKCACPQLYSQQQYLLARLPKRSQLISTLARKT